LSKGREKLEDGGDGSGSAIGGFVLWTGEVGDDGLDDLGGVEEEQGEGRGERGDLLLEGSERGGEVEEGEMLEVEGER
jgi:hypothetical protein